MDTPKKRVFVVLLLSLAVTTLLAIASVGMVSASGMTDDLNAGQSVNAPPDPLPPGPPFDPPGPPGQSPPVDIGGLLDSIVDFLEE